jgi:hypothetical protein
MQVVIDIDEKTYDDFMYLWVKDSDILRAVRNGTPLPKGHGRLIDEDKVLDDIEKKYPVSVSETDKCKKYVRLVYYWAVKNTPTIIEADRGE